MDQPTAEALMREFPDWHVYRDERGYWYAVRTEFAADSTGLRDALQKVQYEAADRLHRAALGE